MTWGAKERTQPCGPEISSVPPWKRDKGGRNLHTCFRKHVSSPGSLARLLQASTSPNKTQGLNAKNADRKTTPKLPTTFFKKEKERERKKESM